MPQDRFLHPRLGHSDKVTLLTDFEYRVWTQYILSADDFGVMRASAVTLQSDNDAIHAKRAIIVERALEHLIVVSLVFPFTHQDRRYVYQPDWQRWQKVEWPRATIQPAPHGADLDRCDEATKSLFGKHPGGVPKKKPKSDPSDSGSVPQILPEPSPSLARARPRETANANAKANASSEGERERKPDADAIADRARWLLEQYPEWYREERHGARLRLLGGPIDFQDACSLVSTWGNARLEQIARIVLTTDDDPFIVRSDRGFKIFVTKASWADDRLKAWELENGVAV